MGPAMNIPSQCTLVLRKKTVWSVPKVAMGLGSSIVLGGVSDSIGVGVLTMPLFFSGLVQSIVLGLCLLSLSDAQPQWPLDQLELRRFNAMEFHLSTVADLGLLASALSGLSGYCSYRGLDGFSHVLAVGAVLRSLPACCDTSMGQPFVPITDCTARYFTE
jgi:hypothetical protein